MRFLLLLFLLVTPLTAYSKADNPQFAIVVPSYNNGSSNNQRCIANIKSLVNQTYPHYTIHIINDCSSDDTGELIANYIRANHLENKVFLTNSPTRNRALKNVYNCIKTLDPETIVLAVDGDDELANPKVIEKLAKIYRNKDVWMTYGNYRSTPCDRGTCCAPITDDICKNRSFRSIRWRFSHLKTFYAKLFMSIHLEDFMWEGDFSPCGWDHIIMYPMLEMASKGHIRFIKDVLYLYYLDNPLRVHRIKKTLQMTIAAEMKKKQPYQPLESLF